MKVENEGKRGEPSARPTEVLFLFDTLLHEGRRFSLLRENLESTELNPDTFPDLKTAQRAFFGTTRPYLEVIRSQSFLKEGALDP
ncbi:MAG: hypothetical protein BRC54_15760 [Cyanobacteria bacterium SW_7_48_12]|nr:MAG: hypothetical protein BRC54_15760 [Cyanobacteria bacterium SW_7_48_12]